MPMFNKKNAFGVFVVAITLLVTWLFWVLQLNNANRLYISQVSFSNNNKQDWVEVYNPSLANVSLKHYYLSDDAEDPTRYQVPFELIVPAHGSAVLWGKSARQVPPGSARLSFNLGNGETVVLSAPKGEQLSEMTLMSPADYKGACTLVRDPEDMSKVEIVYSSSPVALYGGY